MKKKTGRPPLVQGDPTIRVGFTVPKKFWDRVLEHAQEKNLSASKLMRLALVEFLKEN